MPVAFIDPVFVLSWESAGTCLCSQKVCLALAKLLSPLPGRRAMHPCFSHQGSSSASRRRCVFSEWAKKESYKYSHTASFPNTGCTDSSVTICQIWSVQSSRKIWVYTTVCCLKCSFFFFLFFQYSLVSLTVKTETWAWSIEKTAQKWRAYKKPERWIFCLC